MSEPIVLPIWLFLVIGLATTLGAYCWGVWAACNAIEEGWRKRKR